MIRPLALLLLAAGTATAESVVAARTIPAQALIAPGDLALSGAAFAGALEDPALAVGLEARVAIYAGRPVRAADLGAPAVIERNQIVPLVFQAGALVITTEGRALDRAAAGEVVRVMNLASRTTVTARVAADGRALVPG